MKAARILLGEGKLPEGKDGAPLELGKLTKLAFAAVDMIVDECRGSGGRDAQALRALTRVIRAAAAVSDLDVLVAGAMVARLAYFGPAWSTAAAMQVCEDPTIEGGAKLKAALVAASGKLAKVDKLAGTGT